MQGPSTHRIASRSPPQIVSAKTRKWSHPTDPTRKAERKVKSPGLVHNPHGTNTPGRLIRGKEGRTDCREGAATWGYKRHFRHGRQDTGNKHLSESCSGLVSDQARSLPVFAKAYRPGEVDESYTTACWSEASEEGRPGLQTNHSVACLSKLCRRMIWRARGGPRTEGLKHARMQDAGKQRRPSGSAGGSERSVVGVGVSLEE